MISPARLRELLDYDPLTGVFLWRFAPAKSRYSVHPKAGKVAGCLSKKLGYVLICCDGRLYYAHRLAWLHVHGEWPADQVDHINGNRADNRLENLRLADGYQNQANRKVRRDSSSGVKGVYWHAKSNLWMSKITVRGRVISLGYFKKKSDAAKAYANAAQKYNGEFARAA